MSFFIVLIFLGLPNDFCKGCNVGFYGDTCSEKCPQSCHDNECNVTTGKCLSCMKGHYSNNTKDCLLCPEHCTACSSNKFCFACNRGFRGEVCEDNCTNCRPDTSCDKNTGYCFENCSEGQSGELCNIPCDSKCKSCDRHNTDECILCANGYRLEKTCNQTDTVCNIRCKALTEMQPDRQGSSTTDIGLIVGLVIGFIIVAMCVCMIVFITVRRRSSNRRSFWCMSGDRNKTPATNDEENVELMEAKKTNGTRELPSVERITILQKLGTFSAIEKKYDDMKIKVDGNKVTVEGYQLDIEHAFKEIDNKCGDIEHLEYKHSKSKEWLDFYQKEQTIEYVNKKLEQKQLHGICDITDTELNVFVYGKGNSENVITTLFESILEMPVLVDKSLSSEWGGEFVIAIRKKFQEKIYIFRHEQQDMVIICTDDVVKQVTTMVSDFSEWIVDAIVPETGIFEFVSNYWTQDDFDEIRKCGVMIIAEANKLKFRGLLENVVKAKNELNRKLHHICSEHHVLKGTGMVTVLQAAVHSGTISDIEMECKCVIKLQPEIDKSLSAMQSDNWVIISQMLLEDKLKDSSTNASLICFQTRRNKIKIQLIQGDITQQQADIIVVGAASNLDLQSGSAFSASLKQGNSQLQTDYNRLNEIQNDKVAVIDSADFKNLYLTTLPPWKEASRNGGTVLRNFMCECLRLADKFGKNSIAFSIMETIEKLGYPMKMAISIMYLAVVEFDSSYSQTSLKDIIIGMPNDKNIKTYPMCHLKTHEKYTRAKRIFIQDGTILTKPYEESKYRMVKDGCAIGPIQLQVQVGNPLDYTAEVIVMGLATDRKEHLLEKDTVVIQESAGLTAKYVINVLFQDTLASWRSKLVECLEEAAKKDIHSVALHVFRLGIEPQTFSAYGIGECLFAAIDDFTSRKPKSSVRDVRLVVPDSNAGSIPAIIAALQARTTAVNCQRGMCKIFKSQLGFDAESRIFKQSSVTVYSDSTINLDRCIKALDDRLGLEFAKRVVDVDMDVINSLKDTQINSIIDSDIVVDVMFDKQTEKFTIVGPLFNVLAAVTFLHNKMRQYKGKQNNRQSAEVLYDQTRWHWLYVNKMASESGFPYDMMTNLYIETAYKAGTQTVEIQSKDGKIYVIDFQNLVEYPKIDIYDTVMVIRKDIIRPGVWKDVKNWILKSRSAMNDNENIKRVTLDDGEEYQTVKKLFLGKEKNDIDSSKDNSRSIQVVKIERIQNKTLYEQYQAKKKKMKQQKGRELWHETAEDNIQRIINNGFNRSFCRFHEASYGQGVYFAADTFYTIKSNIAENNPGVKRYMFLAKVLTGELIKGSPSMRVLPPVDPAKPTIIYDSAVDDVDEPMHFVIFHEQQAYPKYLITYTSE